MKDRLEQGNTATREKIVLAASAHFFANGHRGVTMEELARIVGVSKKTLYVYFPTKISILEAVMNRKFAEVFVSLDAERRAHPESSVAALSAVIFRWQELLSCMQPVFWHDLHLDASSFLESTVEKRRNIIHNVFGRIITEGIESGEFRGDFNPHVIADIMLATIEGLVRSGKHIEMGISQREIMLMLVTLIIEGSLTDAGRKSWGEGCKALAKHTF
ncbi:MAG TPA: TetR/AcrR family transcriptional regulator [Opitutales bacterium]|nr:TetR/AcrR family transcriptional regulator [Opitutales bacterium]